MKLQFIGTGTFGAKTRALTSMLLGGELLFDVGGGTIRGLQNYGADIGAIKYLVITHYHPDHLFDIPALLLKRKIIYKNATKLTIVGPEGVKNVIAEMMERYFGDGGKSPLGDATAYNLDFIELTDAETQIGGYRIVARTVLHGTNQPASGYEIIYGDQHLGFSGDATKCPGLDEIVNNSETLFLDSTRFGESDESHLNYLGVLGYAHEFPNKKFYLVHRGDYDLGDLPENVFAPDDGDVI
ncbi:MAG: MBL fold metallo-hydrolase [Candidatus Nomurabacteria bacterium]|jgi:ribonuclease BN (tRNA processing enzyme)|nr:MBL fold metallo-hydrolase [Candidatus Nomurabacteria bacterium]